MKKYLKTMERKFFLTLATILTFYECVVAQGGMSNAISALNDATSEVKSIYDPLKKFIWVLAAVCGLFGAIKVYAKIQGKDNEASRHAAYFFLAAFALFIGEIFIRKSFIE